jgi:hypothetical protein
MREFTGRCWVVFRRHWLVFLLPIPLALAITVWVVATKPASYQSQAALWVDNPPSQPSSVGAVDATVAPPAAQQQTLLNELLTTNSFRVAVADHSPLARYLATHSSAGTGPSGLIAMLKGTPPLDERIRVALQGGLLTTVQGPQILAISLLAPTATVAQQTLQALITEFDAERNTVLATRNHATISGLEAALNAANRQATQTHQAVTAYQAQNPTANATSDPTLQALTQAERVVANQVVTATNTLNQVLVANASPASDQSTFRILDAPSTPIGPTSGRLTSLITIFAGLVAGILTSILGVITLTRLEDRKHRTPPPHTQPTTTTNPATPPPPTTTPPQPRTTTPITTPPSTVRPAPAPAAAEPAPIPVVAARTQPQATITIVTPQTTRRVAVEPSVSSSRPAAVVEESGLVEAVRAALDRRVDTRMLAPERPTTTDKPQSAAKRPAGARTAKREDVPSG